MTLDCGTVIAQNARTAPNDGGTRTRQSASPFQSLAHPDCRYWLARQTGPRSVELVDGCHSDPEGVAKAAKLHGRIFADKGPFLMVEIHAMPDLDPPINEEAAATCAHLVMEGTPNA